MRGAGGESLLRKNESAFVKVTVFMESVLFGRISELIEPF